MPAVCNKAILIGGRLLRVCCEGPRLGSDDMAIVPSVARAEIEACETGGKAASEAPLGYGSRHLAPADPSAAATI
jgi:hypothetical protein